MMTISFMCFGNSTRGKMLWKIICLTLMWIMCTFFNKEVTIVSATIQMQESKKRHRRT